MKSLPDAQDAQKKLDVAVEKWQKELESMESSWQQKFNDYDKRKLILTDQGRVNAERELQDLDRKIMDFRDKKFGQNGELFTMENELMQPIQNLVFEQVELMAKDQNYDYVLDKSGGVSIIYAKEAHDLTEKLIDRIKKLLPERKISDQPGDQTPRGTQPPAGTGGRPTPTPTPSPDGSQVPMPPRDR
jgi:outer membrane protein